MTSDDSWVESLVESAREAGKNAWLGLETSAIIASSPAGIIEDSGLVTDPIGQAAITALDASHESLVEMVQAQAKADELAESTDVSHEPTTSLLVDPPSWLESAGDITDEDNGLDDDSEGFV